MALEGNGEALRQVIDACAGLESLAPARRMLQEAFRQRPEELELGLNLAEVLVLEQEEGRAGRDVGAAAFAGRG